MYHNGESWRCRFFSSTRYVLQRLIHQITISDDGDYKNLGLPSVTISSYDGDRMASYMRKSMSVQVRITKPSKTVVACHTYRVRCQPIQ